MNDKTLQTAINEAERFLERALNLKAMRRDEAARVKKAKEAGEKYVYPESFPKECGFVKRASMDLTRALADLRRPA